jgi:sec-independent protein translocase protein TatB
MFDLGWSEMLLIGIVALVVVGPKELPGLFRSVGQAIGKARGMAREFTRAMETAADESGVREIDRTIRAATRPVQFATDRLRETATGTKSALPPLNPGAPVKPGGATEALAAERAQAREETLAAAAERRVADAERRAAEAERRAQEAERRAAATAQPRTDETA